MAARDNEIEGGLRPGFGAAPHDDAPLREPGVYRRPVDSSLIRSVGYDLPSSVLEIEFVGEGRVYEYLDVPLSVYSRLVAAQSIGNFFNESIRDVYSYQQID